MRHKELDEYTIAGSVKLKWTYMQDEVIQFFLTFIILFQCLLMDIYCQHVTLLYLGVRNVVKSDVLPKLVVQQLMELEMLLLTKLVQMICKALKIIKLLQGFLVQRK